MCLVEVNSESTADENILDTGDDVLDETLHYGYYSNRNGRRGNSLVSPHAMNSLGFSSPWSKLQIFCPVYRTNRRFIASSTARIIVSSPVTSRCTAFPAMTSPSGSVTKTSDNATPDTVN